MSYWRTCTVILMYFGRISFSHFFFFLVSSTCSAVAVVATERDCVSSLVAYAYSANTRTVTTLCKCSFRIDCRVASQRDSHNGSERRKKRAKWNGIQSTMTEIWNRHTQHVPTTTAAAKKCGNSHRATTALTVFRFDVADRNWNVRINKITKNKKHVDNGALAKRWQRLWAHHSIWMCARPW